MTNLNPEFILVSPSGVVVKSSTNPEELKPFAQAIIQCNGEVTMFKEVVELPDSEYPETWIGKQKPNTTLKGWVFTHHEDGTVDVTTPGLESVSIPASTISTAGSILSQLVRLIYFPDGESGTVA